MNVLIFGPSGSGKTYLAHAWQRQGINAFDDDEVLDLSAWYNRSGRRVSEPASPEEATQQQLAFLWSRKALARFLAKHDNVYLFGGSGNIAQVFDLFDAVYFLKVDADLQRERLNSPDRPTPHLDRNEAGLVIWGDWFEELARQCGIPFLDASLTPDEIWRLIDPGSNPT